MEAELELALYLAGTISKDNFGNPRKVSWSRSGRTDKGVHAVAQVGGWGEEGMFYFFSESRRRCW